MLRGPITAHPQYGATAADLLPEAQAPRVKPEALDIYLKSQGSVGLVLDVQGEAISFPVNSARKKVKPTKDHIHENVRRMRQIQKETKLKEESIEPPKPVKALWKSEKYSEVGSKVVEDLKASPRTPRPETANYLRAHSRSGFAPPLRSSCASPRPPSALSVPRATSAADVRMQRREVDFIKSNGVSARHSAQRRSVKEQEAAERKDRTEQQLQAHRKGYLPKYLVARREEWAREEEERIRNTPDPDMPAGHRRMEEEERRRTLELLQKNQQALLSELNSLPIRTDTYRVRTEKEKLQARLGEIEEAIKIFSRPKVFVKDD